MEQPTFGELEYENKKRKTRREKFLERKGLIPWEWKKRPYYPKAGRGRRPYELSAMLRIPVCSCLQPERSRHGGPALRGGVGETVRGAETVGSVAGRDDDLNFRHLLEQHRLGEGLMKEINGHLESQGLRLQEGTIVDASIIEAPSSTKNRAGERDPEMHQTKKVTSGISE